MPGRKHPHIQHPPNGTLCDRITPGFHDDRVVHSQSVREGLRSGLERRGREELRRVRDTRDQDIYVLYRRTGGLRIALEVGIPFWNLTTLPGTSRLFLLPKHLLLHYASTASYLYRAGAALFKLY